MATQLRLKVSEAKVLETIDNLTRCIDNMENHLQQLIVKREKIEVSYNGPSARKAVEAIKEHEVNAKRAIENYRSQKEKLQQYIEMMNSTDSAIANQYDEALSMAQNIFS